MKYKDEQQQKLKIFKQCTDQVSLLLIRVKYTETCLDTFLCDPIRICDIVVIYNWTLSCLLFLISNDDSVCVFVNKANAGSPKWSNF